MGIAALGTTFALALADVCRALGLTAAEHDRVLGRDAAAYVAAVGQARFWPMERQRKAAAEDLVWIVAIST